jgi:Amt family ammonium transporter
MVAFAQSGVQAGVVNGSDTAWVLTSTALVLFMTLPGLALFYGGLVQSKNVLSVLAQCFAIAALMSVLWMVVGYSIAFGGANMMWGGLGKVMLRGIGLESNWGTLPEVVFVLFQMTFAAITPALVVGAFPERMKFSAVLLFSGLWMVIVYAPLTHWIWGGGFMAAWGVMDFAGGLVVHASCGVAAIVVALMLGRRKGFPGELHPPHNPGMTMMGAAMLWVGWYGFNGGSALSAGAGAGMAILVTHISAATAAITWMVIEWVRFGKPSLIGIVTGAIAGLATITPGSGFVGPVAGLVYGMLAAIICFWFVTFIKFRLRIDDSLDVFAVHGVGGMLGILLTGVFASPIFGGLGLPDGHGIVQQVGLQALGVVITLAWSGVISAVLLIAIRAVVGLRVSDEDEIEGLDLTTHGERSHTV